MVGIFEWSKEIDITNTTQKEEISTETPFKQEAGNAGTASMR